MSQTKELQEIRKRFYAYRNGALVDSLKSQYPEGKLIFGLLLPQLMEIAKLYQKDLNLASALWDDKNCRESRLLSLYLFPLEEIKKERAKEMFYDIQSYEEADNISFRIFRHLPYAKELFSDLKNTSHENPLFHYALQMFERNLNVQNS